MDQNVNKMFAKKMVLLVDCTLTSTRAIVLQLVTVHGLLGVCPFPGGAMNMGSKRREGMKG